MAGIVPAETLAAIRVDHPELAADLAGLYERAGDTRIQTLTASDGTLTARWQERYLHSSRAPAREAQKHAATLQTDNDVPVICLGLGLGYHPAALRDAGLTCVCIVAEPAEVATCLEVRDASWWAGQGPQRVFGDATALVDWLREQAIERFDTLVLAAFADHEALTTAKRTLDRYRDRRTINRNTMRAFGTVWVRNLLRNNALWHGDRPLDALIGSASQATVLVAAAGPSLDRVLPQLGGIDRTTIVVAVDTAVVSLRRYGIHADVVLVADPQYWNTRHLDTVSTRDLAALVVDPAVHPRVRRLWHGPVYTSASVFPLGAYLDRAAGRFTALGAGGSVATAAWDFARLLGAERIAMAGLDLGFPAHRTHAQGSFFEERSVHRAHRLLPAEHVMAGYIYSGAPRYVESTAGAPVLSDARMAVYRTWFEEQNRRHPGVSTVVLDRSGSKIDGMVYQHPAEFLAQAGSSPVGPTEFRRKLISTAAVATDASALTRLHQELGELRSLLERAQRHIELLLYHDTISATALRVAQSYDQRLSDSGLGELAGFLAHDQIEAAVGAPASDPRASLEQSRSLYQAIIRSAANQLEYLERILRQTDQEKAAAGRQTE